MFSKTDLKGKSRDGKHCDLCGCSFPAVRCDKCSSQIFCLSCDDMYHRHPKRKFHLRKAVDPTPTPQARPVLPIKVSNLPLAPGDPSKMPLPPPRKKKPGKSIFDSFRKGSPSSDDSSSFSKKDYSWTDRLGSIRKFMSNRPLPPIPVDEVENSPPETTSTLPSHSLAFIHRRVDDKPPALPQRSQPKLSVPLRDQANENVAGDSFPNTNHLNRQLHQDSSLQGNLSRIANGSSMAGVVEGEDGGHEATDDQASKNFRNAGQQPFLNNSGVSGFGTLRRQHDAHGLPAAPHMAYPSDKPGGMHHSSSATDLTSLPGMQAFPQYPYNPHLPPQYPYPYPVYPQYPSYPTHFGSSWGNLNSPLHTTDGDFSDQSESSSNRFGRGRHSAKDKKAKRSQSMLMDHMAFQGQFFPYGPYPPGMPSPWVPMHPSETPPSPSMARRSSSRGSHSRRRRKVTDDDDDDYSSSPMSRPKSSSSEISRNLTKAKSYPSSQSSDDEEEEVLSKPNMSPSVGKKFTKHNFRRRTSSPQCISPSRKHSDASAAEEKGPVSRHKKKVKEKPTTDKKSEDADEQSVVQQLKSTTLKDESKEPSPAKEDDTPLWSPPTPWRCKYCTFINLAGERICQVCCRTATKSVSPVEENQPDKKDFGKDESVVQGEDQAVHATVPSDTQHEKHDMAVLNSALDEAEKEINRSLEELLKVQNIAVKSHVATSPKNTDLNDASLGTSVSPKQSECAFNQSQINAASSAPSSSVSVSSVVTNSSYPQTVSFTSCATSPVRDQSTYTSNVTADSLVTSGDQNSENTDVLVKNTETRKDSFCQTYDTVTPLHGNVESFVTSADARYAGHSQKHPVYSSGTQVDVSHNGIGPLSEENVNRSAFPSILHRSHSRSSLLGGRLGDTVSSENFGTGFGLSSMYRSISRASLLGETDGWNPEYPAAHKPKFYLSMEELVERRRQETMRAQGLELVRMIREAEQLGFTADDIQVALNNCGKQNPVNWLQENWKNVIKTVVTLATNYGRDKSENDVGVISESEARDALRLHKGNIWASVTECVEGRQRKFLELSARGNFTFKEIIDALNSSEGDVEVAYAKLTNTSMKPFLMRIWGSGEGMPNLDGALPKLNDSMLYKEHLPFVNKAQSEGSENISSGGEDYDVDDGEWRSEGMGAEYDEEEEEEEPVTAYGTVFENTPMFEHFSNENTVHLENAESWSGEKLLTPESDKSDYCDAFGSGLGERYMSSTSIDEIYLIDADEEKELFEMSHRKEVKRKSSGLLNKLGILRRNSEHARSQSPESHTSISDKDIGDSSAGRNQEVGSALSVAEEINQKPEEKSSAIKDFSPVSVLKQTFNAIKNSVVGSGKSSPKAVSEKRTIIVRDQVGKEVTPSTKSEDLPQVDSEGPSTLTSEKQKTVQCDLNSAERVSRPNTEADVSLGASHSLSSIDVGTFTRDQCVEVLANEPLPCVSSDGVSAHEDISCETKILQNSSKTNVSSEKGPLQSADTKVRDKYSVSVEPGFMYSDTRELHDSTLLVMSQQTAEADTTVQMNGSLSGGVDTAHLKIFSDAEKATSNKKHSSGKVCLPVKAVNHSGSDYAEAKGVVELNSQQNYIENANGIQSDVALYKIDKASRIVDNLREDSLAAVDLDASENDIIKSQSVDNYVSVPEPKNTSESQSSSAPLNQSQSSSAPLNCEVPTPSAKTESAAEKQCFSHVELLGKGSDMNDRHDCTAADYSDCKSASLLLPKNESDNTNSKITVSGPFKNELASSSVESDHMKLKQDVIVKEQVIKKLIPMTEEDTQFINSENEALATKEHVRSSAIAESLLLERETKESKIPMLVNNAFSTVDVNSVAATPSKEEILGATNSPESYEKIVPTLDDVKTSHKKETGNSYNNITISDLKNSDVASFQEFDRNCAEHLPESSNDVVTLAPEVTCKSSSFLDAVGSVDSIVSSASELQTSFRSSESVHYKQLCAVSGNDYLGSEGSQINENVNLATIENNAEQIGTISESLGSVVPSVGSSSDLLQTKPQAAGSVVYIEESNVKASISVSAERNNSASLEKSSSADMDTSLLPELPSSCSVTGENKENMELSAVEKPTCTEVSEEVDSSLSVDTNAVSSNTTGNKISETLLSNDLPKSMSESPFQDSKLVASSSSSESNNVTSSAELSASSSLSVAEFPQPDVKSNFESTSFTTDGCTGNGSLHDKKSNSILECSSSTGAIFKTDYQTLNADVVKTETDVSSEFDDTTETLAGLTANTSQASNVTGDAVPAEVAANEAGDVTDAKSSITAGEEGTAEVVYTGKTETTKSAVKDEVVGSGSNFTSGVSSVTDSESDIVPGMMKTRTGKKDTVNRDGGKKATNRATSTGKKKTSKTEHPVGISKGTIAEVETSPDVKMQTDQEKNATNIVREMSSESAHAKGKETNKFVNGIDAAPASNTIAAATTTIDAAAASTITATTTTDAASITVLAARAQAVTSTNTDDKDTNKSVPSEPLEKPEQTTNSISSAESEASESATDNSFHKETEHPVQSSSPSSLKQATDVSKTFERNDQITVGTAAMTDDSTSSSKSENGQDRTVVTVHEEVSSSSVSVESSAKHENENDSIATKSESTADQAAGFDASEEKSLGEAEYAESVAESIDNSEILKDNVISADEKAELPVMSENMPSPTHDSDFQLQNLSVRPASPVRPVGPLRRMSFNTRREAIFQERNKDSLVSAETKSWMTQKKYEPVKTYYTPKRSIKQQLEFERKVRNLVSERKCRTYRKAEIVVQLMDMNFNETDSLYAANECSTFDQALSFLQQECQLCAGKYPVGEIVSMVHCPHKACKECIKAYFTIQIRDRTIMELLCPFCNEPDITDEDVAQDYFNHLDILLKKLVEPEIHELFQRKLRDRVLMKDPNFRWCSQCSSGFIADPNLRKLMCPDCNAITCAGCRRLWEREHEGVSCEAFAEWKDANDPEAQTASLAKLLTEDGIDCPSCHFRYALAKGGCMHFKCIQCHHDFCSGCTKPFRMGQKCGVSEFCVKLGLHAHHPRNCLFYLRDKEPEDLQRLLEMNDIKYNKEIPEGSNHHGMCQVLEQKETPQGMVDDICGKDIQEGYAGLCRVHYVEYLGQLVNKHKIDPIQVFDNDDLELVLKRASIRLPPKKYRESSEEYRGKLVQLIEEKLPLCEVEGS